MTVLRNTLLALAGIILCACSEGGNDQTSIDCPLTIDSVETLLTKDHQGEKYFLVKRVSGWHDKTVIIQLFDQAPELDKCNEDKIPPIFEDSIETNLPFVKLIVNLENNEFDVVYAEDSTTTQPVELVFEN